TDRIDLDKLEMSQPFFERVILAIARKFGDIALRFTPQNWLNSIARKLELAGSPSKMDPSTFLSSQFMTGVGFGALMIVLDLFVIQSTPLGQKFILTLVAVAFGFYLPQFNLSTKITARQKSIRKSLPDALDLLTICVEAGLGFDQAMVKVAEKWESPLSAAFGRVIQEIQLGKLRREALRDMAQNVDIPEMTSFIAIVIQSEMLGVSMAKVLRIQADQMRVKRRQLAEEEAHKAPIKMLIPMALLIFPSLMLILFTPAVMQVMSSGLMGGL
ncbi:MAG: type II secretion system F family protein, partial [Anaerolineaceae bacterium]|nr:type II secretion system F family protein [Anaerolineaceae bacterium]